MASSPCGSGNFDSGLEIKTRSVEQTLVPLVSQVSFFFARERATSNFVVNTIKGRIVICFIYQATQLSIEGEIALLSSCWF